MDHAIKGLLFDKDGTLFDFHATWGGWTADLLVELSNGDAKHAKQMAAVWGFDLDKRQFNPNSIIIAGTPKDMIDALSPLLPDWDKDALANYIITTSSNAPLKEAVPLGPLLEGFRARGFKLGISTNDTETPARAHLDAAGIAGHFEFIAGSDSGFGAKPAPGMQHGFCAAVGLKPEQVAMVGDSTHDLVAGRAAGMTTIGVLTGPASAADLQDHADVVLNDIGDIPGYLARR